MSDFELVKNRLAQSDLAELKQLSARIRVPYQTLYNIRKGLTKNPRVKTVEQIAKGLREA
jgi:predicted transcriptional regulator